MSITFAAAPTRRADGTLDFHTSDDEPWVNVSNTNASLLLERLGIEFDYSGQIDAEDLLGRALVANVGRDDSGMASTTDRGAGGATIIDCGLRPGYFDERMAQLVEVAEYAKTVGTGKVQWA
jgi:hypothetical protein